MRRRAFLRAIAAGTVAAVAGCAGRQSIGGDGGPSDQERTTGTPPWEGIATGEWPSYGGDPGNTGYRPDGTGPNAGDVAWRAIGSRGTVNSGAAVVDGTVYVGSATPGFHAIDARTGEQSWRAIPRTWVATVPTVAGADGSADGRDTVFFADADGIAFAYSTDGERRWRRRTDHDLHSQAVAVTEGLVILGASGALKPSEAEEPGVHTSHVLALDAATGERRWSFQGRDWFLGPAVGGGRAYVSNESGTVSALDVTTGEEVWSWDVSGNDHGLPRPSAEPVATQGTVYVPVQGLGVVALDWADGSVQWTSELEHTGVGNTPAAGDGRVYVGSNGSQGWPVGEPKPSTTTTSDPMDGGYSVGNVYALDAATGDPIWRNKYGRKIRSPPVVRDGTVYVGTEEGLQAITTEGEDLFHAQFGDYVEAAPTVIDGRAYVGCADGYLYCVGET